MLNTFKNLSRKGHKYGDVQMVSFLSAILARLAYCNDNTFLKYYSSIMGPVILPQIMQGIDSVDPNNLKDIIDDEKIYGLTAPDSVFADYLYEYNGKKYIDFLKAYMPQNVNILIDQLKGDVVYPIPSGPATESAQVKYISLAWSNYGEIYLVADKRMPKTLFLLCRGTYSPKTAALYLKPTSLVPLNACTNSDGTKDTFLYGIFKATSEIIHTIVESASYLATDFLGATQPNSVKIFLAGHSLGGAMVTNLAYLWMNIIDTAPYNAAPYNVLAKNIICMSLGAPRCMGKSVARKFCGWVKEGKIMYLRIATKGDPVPSLPPASFGFEHPCSNDEAMKKQVFEDCTAQLVTRPLPNINYEGNLDCLNYKARAYVLNMISHTVYLDIMYTKAVSMDTMVKSASTLTGTAEIARMKDGSTVCRVIVGQLDNYKVIFFNVNSARSEPDMLDAAMSEDLSKGVDINSAVKNAEQSAPASAPAAGGGWFSDKFASAKNAMSSMKTPSVKMPSMKFGGKVKEDVRMSKEAFDLLIGQLQPLQGDLAPLEGKVVNPFGKKMMPDLSCKTPSTGGRRTRRNRTKTRRTKRRAHKRHASRKYRK